MKLKIPSPGTPVGATEEAKPQNSDTMDFRAFPNCCLAALISFTRPLDACRLSLVSTDFKSAADSDIVWDKFLPADYRSLIRALPPTSSKKELFLSLCDHPVLIGDGKMVNMVAWNWKTSIYRSLNVSKGGKLAFCLHINWFDNYKRTI